MGMGGALHVCLAPLQAFGSNFFGIAIDRLDHLSMWNNEAAPEYDDGLAWCGSPCYPLMS